MNVTATQVFNFISQVADQAFSFTFKCFGYEITFYNLMFCSLVFVGFFSVLGIKLDLGVEQNNIARNKTRRDKVKEENRRKNEAIRMHEQARKDGIPLKK